MIADYAGATVLEAANYIAGEYPKKLITLHDVESPEGKLWAEVLMGPAWFGKKTTQASCQYMVDEDSTVQGVPELAWAFHCGKPGSKISIGIEQAGYARFTRAEWMTPSMVKQRRQLVALGRDIMRRRDIPARWATHQDIRDAVRGEGPGGWCHHYDITDAVGGTTHTDTGKFYPDDLLMAELQGVSTPPVIPIPTPIEEILMFTFSHEGMSGVCFGNGTYLLFKNAKDYDDFRYVHAEIFGPDTITSWPQSAGEISNLNALGKAL